MSTQSKSDILSKPQEHPKCFISDLTTLTMTAGIECRLPEGVRQPTWLEAIRAPGI
jgi:hypothetical protein